MKISKHFVGDVKQFLYFYKRGNDVCWDGRLLKLKYPTEIYIYSIRDEFIFNDRAIFDLLWLFENSNKNSNIVRDYFPAKVMTEFERIV